jgi:hypothetical protein
MDRIKQVSDHVLSPAKPAPAQPMAPGASSADLVPDIVRAFLRHEFHSIDPNLDDFMKELASRGGGECWHKRYYRL